MGRSSQPGIGYDWDTFAGDLHALMEHLDLRDAVLVGHSMGSGDVTPVPRQVRLGRVSKAVLVSPIPPYFQSADDDPRACPAALFDGFVASARDRPAVMAQGVPRQLLQLRRLRRRRRLAEAFRASLNIALAGSPIAAVQCIHTWGDDFRADVAAFDVPILVIQGDQDRVLPLELTGQRLPGLVEGPQARRDRGRAARHPWTHAEQVNDALRTFLN